MTGMNLTWSREEMYKASCSFCVNGVCKIRDMNKLTSIYLLSTYSFEGTAEYIGMTDITGTGFLIGEQKYTMWKMT